MRSRGYRLSDRVWHFSCAGTQTVYSSPFLGHFQCPVWKVKCGQTWSSFINGLAFTNFFYTQYCRPTSIRHKLCLSCHSESSSCIFICPLLLLSHQLYACPAWMSSTSMNSLFGLLLCLLLSSSKLSILLPMYSLSLLLGLSSTFQLPAVHTSCVNHKPFREPM